MKPFFKACRVLLATVIFSTCSIFTSSAAYQLTVEATAYNAYEGSGIAADGTPAVPYATIAVDPDVIPLGSIVYVPGFGEMRANDTGGAINGHKIDICMGDNASCYEWGRRTITVTVY